MQTGIAVVFIGLGGVLSVLNWLSLYQTYRTGRFCSAIPLIGAFFLGCGLLILPETRPFAWVALIADYGTLIFLIAVPMLVLDLWRTSRFNLLAEYVGEVGNQSVRLQLYRKNLSVLKQTIRRNPNEVGVMERSVVGTWKWDENRLIISVGEDSTVFEPIVGSTPDAIVQISGFRCDEDRELSLSGIELVVQSRKIM